MNEHLEIFENTRISNILFFVLAVISIFLAFYFYLKARKEKVPVFSIKTLPLIMDNLTSIEKLKFFYADKELRNLSMTKIAFWNSGRETLKKNDIAPADKLRIVPAENIIIYDFNIEIQNGRNNFKVKKKENELNLSFDYLNKNDGILLTVFHSGKSSKDIKLKGSFIGAKPISKGFEKAEVIWKSRFVKFIENWINKDNSLITGFIPFFIMVFSSIFVIGPVYLITRVLEKYIHNAPKEFGFRD